MASHARERDWARAIARSVAIASIVACCWIASATAAQGDASAPDPLRSRTDAQLATQAAALEAEATAIGERLLEDDARRDDIVRERDAARGLLAQLLAESYKQSTTNGSVAQQVLASGSLAEAADRLRVADVVGGYHANVVGSLDDAEAQLDVSQVQRARLVVRLTGIQEQLVPIRDEQLRRAAIRAAYEAERQQQRAQEAAAAAQRERDAERASGLLVGSSGGAFVGSGGTASAASIDAYLASKGSPMAGQGAAFVASGARWRVDPRLLVAIAGAESSFGQVTCGPHNAWGWACPNDPADFETWAAGIDTVTEGLRNYYLDEGRTSVSLIQQKYCPVGAANDPTGLNSHWTTNVTKFLLEQGGNPSSVGPGPSGAGALQLPGFGLVADD